MRFTKKDLEIFEVPGFADRMQLIDDTIHPKLAKLAELLNPQLSRAVGHNLYTQLAVHARRTVNPPSETGISFSPDANNYKTLVHFALYVGQSGVQARVVTRPECKSRRQLSSNIINYLDKLSNTKGHREMEDYSKKNEEAKGAPITDWPGFLKETSKKLKENNTLNFDLGINLPLSGDLSSHAIQAFNRLLPFYLLGHNLPWNPQSNGGFGW